MDAVYASTEGMQLKTVRNDTYIQVERFIEY